MTEATSRLRLLLIGLLFLANLSEFLQAPASAGEQNPADSAGSWRLVQTPNPQGGPQAVSIMHTADTSRSDVEFAGLMVRCKNGMSELAIALLNALPLRSHPRVIIGNPENETQFEATIGPPGTAVILPGDPKIVMGNAWQAESDLFIRVIDGPINISGVVPLAGLQAAFTRLMSSCPMQ